MTAKWTPGPWAVQEHDDTLMETFIGEASNPKSACIAKVPMWNGLRQDDEQEANARLIAAAPDLAEALKAVLEVYVPIQRDGYSDIGGVTTRARAALRAAGWEE